MFYIHKGQEPKSLTEYKKQEGAYFDGYPNKDDIRQSLMDEQGCLCAYCMRRIANIHDVKIEHYLPQSRVGETESLDYRYMLGVCKINSTGPYSTQTCDSHKGNATLTVNPWSEQSIAQIYYEHGTGIIKSDDVNIHKDLDETLNLNYVDSWLPSNRKRALDELKQYLVKLHKRGTWGKTMLERLKSHYLSKEQNGQYQEYIGILIWYINKKLQQVN